MNVRSDVKLSEVFQARVASLLLADTPRHGPEREEHTRLLADSEADLPPIIVHKATLQVVDGRYRVRAAALRGHEEIAARFFDGPLEDAFVLAVQVNTVHGLPLSLKERTAAAGRILATHPHWSDRAIASVAGLSAKTVGARRRQLGGAVIEAAARIGRDGRARPVNTAEGRRVAARIILESPDASLRDIAEQAGISPGTIRDVRARLSRGEDVIPTRQRDEDDVPRSAVPQQPWPCHMAESEPAAHAVGDQLADIFRDLCRDPSLRLTDDGRQLLHMVRMHVLGSPDWERVAESVPQHQARSVSAMALECARMWERFSSQVRDRGVLPVG